MVSVDWNEVIIRREGTAVREGKGVTVLESGTMYEGWFRG
jgi:hypothetical protein